MNKVIKPEHVNIFYLGSNGGHFCLHLLLLTKQYNCMFEKELPFKKIFTKQWEINSIENWKNTEFHTNNKKTLESALLTNKVFLFCNTYQRHLTFSGCKVLIYTDSKTEWMLSAAKNVGIFFPDKNTEEFQKKSLPELDVAHRRLLEFIINEYNNIKANSWPDCNQFEDFVNLSDDIKQELVIKWDFTNRWDFDRFDSNAMIEKYTRANSNTYNSDLVSITDEMIASSDIIIKLQDLVKTNGNILFEKLGIQGNQQCIDFTNKWLNLHTDELKAMILK